MISVRRKRESPRVVKRTSPPPSHEGEAPRSGLRRSHEPLLLIGLAMLGAGAVLLATREGVGISPDSSVYLSVAENVSKGEGVTVPFRLYPLANGGIGTPPPGDVEPEPSTLTHYQPLLPVVLSQAGPRTVNAASLGLIVFLVGWAVFSFTGLLWKAVAAAVLVGGSVHLLTVSATVLSEPLFAALVVASLALLTQHLRKPSFFLLLCSSSAIALAILTRYAGVALVLTGLVLLRHRVRDAVVLVVVSCVPPGVWLLFNGASTNRTIAFHWRLGAPKEALRTAGAWVLPTDAPGGLLLVGGLAVTTAVVVVLARARLRELSLVMVVFLGAYAFVLTATALFVDATTWFDQRLLMPVFIALVVAMVCLTQAKVLFAVLTVLTVGRAGLWLAGDHPGVLGYAGAWQSSPIMEVVRTLPEHLVVYSNAPDAIWAVTGRAVSTVPEKTNFSTARANARFPEHLTEMARALRQRDGVLVYIRLPHRQYVPSESELRDRLQLRLLRNEPDGAVYSVPRGVDAWSR